MHLLLLSVILPILASTSPVANAAPKPGVWPQSIEVTFQLGDKVVFELFGDRVEAVTVYVAGAAQSVPKDVCAKLHYVQFDSVHMIYPVGASTLRTSNGFELRFNVGPESRRSSGDLPEIDLEFRQASFRSASIVTRNGDGWLTSEL